MRNRIIGGIGVALGAVILLAFFFAGAPRGEGVWYVGQVLGLFAGVGLIGAGAYYSIRGGVSSAPAGPFANTSPLLHRLAVVRTRYRLVTFASGIFATAAFVVGVITLVGLADSMNHLPRFIRAAALCGLLAGTGFLIYQLLVYPLGRRSDNLSLALRIEDQHPELNDALASTIQFLENPNSPLAGDPALRERAIAKATHQASSFDFHAILDYRFLGITAAALLVTVAAAGHFLYHEPELSRTALLRVADPFGNHPWTNISVPDPQVRIAVGQPFKLRGELAGVVPGTAKIEMQAKNPITKKYENRPDMLVPVKAGSSKRSGSFATMLDVSQKPLEFQYRVTSNDGSFPPRRGAWHTVAVLPPPAFSELDGLPSPQIRLHYPDYTGLDSPKDLSPGTRHLDMIQGTVVEFRAAVDRPLKSAVLEFKPVDPSLRLSTLCSLVGGIGGQSLLPKLGAVATHGSWVQEITLDPTGTKLSANFRPWIAGVYTIHLADENNPPLTKSYEADLRVAVDPIPTVQMRRPVSSQSYLETAEVPVRIVAEDDLFAVRSIFLEYRKKNAQGDWVDAAPTRVTLYDPATHGAALRALTGIAAPFERLAPMRAKRLEAGKNWALKSMFKVGDIVAVHGAADDFCDLFPSRQPGHSHEVEFRIVSNDDLAREVDQKFAEVQQDLAAIKQIEDEVQKLLDAIPKNKDDPKENAKALDQAIEAAQKAKQVKERLGNRPDEGVRDKLAKIEQTMKDNKLPESELKDQVKGVAAEVERLVQEDFPKLEQDLADLRKELAGAQKSKDDKSPLDKSKESNKDIQKSINDLAKSLDRFADLQQLRADLRNKMDAQQALADRTDKLNKDMDKLNKEAELADTKQAKKLIEDEKQKLRDEAGAIAGDQKKLQEEMKNLMSKMDQVKRRQKEVEREEKARAEDGDKDAVQRAADASDAAKKIDAAKNAAGTKDDPKLDKQMADAAEALKRADPRGNEARQKQAEAKKTMDQMMAALDGKKDDEDRLRRKQKDADIAQEKLGDVRKQIGKMQNQPKGQKIDPKQQAKDLRQAAEDLKDEARRLMRLQEPKAARELQRAADELENAAKKVEAGENADQEEAKAQEHIANAEQQLQHLQEELAREQLARIGDRLKGLKERQDAALERTKELQKKTEANWTRGLVEALGGDQKSQVGLAGETQSLEEKLKGAAVFEHILKKAGKAMTQAADSMTEHKEVAKQIQVAGNDPDALKKLRSDDKARFDETLKQQKMAADRLDRLLEALKDTPPQVAKKDPPKDQKNPEGKQEPKEDQGGMRAQDGIPPMAQLKALKAEQIEVFERTKDFARANPDPMNLNDAQQRELRELTEEQGRLRQLFEQMTRKKDGDQ